MGIGHRIHELRTTRQMSIPDLAAACGLSVADLEAVEAGNRQLSHQEITVLAKTLDVQPDDLFIDPPSDESVGNSVLIPTDKLNQLLKQMADD